MRHIRRWLGRLLALVALVGAGFAIYYVVNEAKGTDSCPSDPFDTKQFAKDVNRLEAGKDPEGEREQRAREQARRAVECEEVVGRNEPSLRVLLGKPTRRKSVASGTPHENWTWVVGIGKPRPVLLVQVTGGRATYAEAPGEDSGGKPLSRGDLVDRPRSGS